MIVNHEDIPNMERCFVSWFLCLSKNEIRELYLMCDKYPQEPILTKVRAQLQNYFPWLMQGVSK